MKNSKKCSFFHQIDLFRKEPEFYYNGSSKYTNILGIILTWIYIAIYLVFFIYKFIRMINREDVSFSETTASSPGSLPKLKVDKETFVYALSLTNESNVPYIDESIYFPTATIVEQKFINNQRVVNMIPIEIGVCTPDDFGKNYQKYLTRLPINSFYCFKNFSVEFEGYSSAENFTMIQIVVNKCNFTENPDKCLSNNDIISKLEGRELMVVSEDFDITPYDFDNPVKERLNINYCPIRMDQYSIFASYYQLTNIETDYNLFGFEIFSDIRSKKYLVYDSPLIMALSRDVNQIPAIQYNVLLTEKILTNQRTYTKFIDILGDIGGFMEVVYSIFATICSFFLNISYEKDIANNLFDFDLNNYSIKIKKQIKLNKNETQNLNNINIDKNVELLNMNLNKTNKIVMNLNSNGRNKILNSDKNSNNSKNSNRKSLKDSKSNRSLINKDNYIDNLNSQDVKIFGKENEIKEMNSEKIVNINEMNYFFAYLCFCCPRKKEQLGNILLEEALNLIMKNLDVYTLFKGIYYLNNVKNINDNYEYKHHDISDEGKSKLKDILK